MKLFITESKLNKIIQEELKVLQEGRAELVGAVSEFGDGAVTMLNRLIRDFGEEAGEKYVNILKKAEEAEPGAVLGGDGSGKVARRLGDDLYDKLETSPSVAAAVRKTAPEISSDELETITKRVFKGDLPRPSTAPELSDTEKLSQGLRRSAQADAGEALTSKMRQTNRPNLPTARQAAAAAGGLAGLAGGANLAAAATDGEGTSTIQPVPTPGGSPSLPTGGTATASGWERYLRGSQYVTKEQAKQVHDAWKAYVASPAPMQEQAGGLDDSFQSFQRWWKAAMAGGKLGKHGSPEDTIKWLQNNTNVGPVDQLSESFLRESTYNRWQKLIR